jgi:HPt (histidine-containing phosphotransfer) domain-containing protein
MNDYISKPVQLEALERIMQRAIDHFVEATPLQTQGNGTIIDPAALAVLQQLRRPDRPDPVAELIDLFLHETPERLREMRTAITQYNADALSHAAHSLRGCAGSIGAVRMASLCEELEENAERRALQVSSRLLKEIETEFDKARQALEVVKAESAASGSGTLLPS